MLIGTLGSQSRGRVIRLSHNDPGVHVAIEAGYDRLVYERSTDGGLTYSEFQPPAERLVLEKTKTDYVVVDRLGDSSFWYRSRYLDEKHNELSDPSEPVEGAGLALLGLITVAELKQRYLFGLDLSNDQGIQYPDSAYEHYILSAVSWLEHQLDIFILPTTIIGEKHDYYRNDAVMFNFIQLEHYPVISVEELNVRYPSGQSVIRYPQEWLSIDKTHGLLRVVPTAGTMSEVMLAQGGSFLPTIYGGAGYLPDLFHVDYTAGFEDGRIPRLIIDIIGKVASLGPFNIFGDLIAGAGIATFSVSVDGLSQNIGTTASATNAGFGSRIIQYLKEVKDALTVLKLTYKGLKMTVM